MSLQAHIVDRPASRQPPIPTQSWIPKSQTSADLDLKRRKFKNSEEDLHKGSMRFRRTLSWLGFREPGSGKIGRRVKRPRRSPVPEEQYSNIESLGAAAIVKETLTEDDIVIAVMGPMKSGKSSFIETATGVEVGVGHGIESHTSKCQAVRVTFEGCSVVLVDTPGFDDTYKCDLEILKLISSWLKDMYKNRLFLSGILYLHDMSETRMAGTLLKNLDMFKKLCGEDAYRKIVLTTTMWESINPDSEARREKELREKELTSKYWKAMIDGGSVTRRFEQRTRKAAWDILNHIITQGSDGTAIQIQKELVELKLELPKTQAGQELYGIIESLFEQQENVLGQLKEQLQRTSDPVILQDLANELVELRREQEAVIASMNQLRLDSSLIGRLRQLFRIGYIKPSP